MVATKLNREFEESVGYTSSNNYKQCEAVHHGVSVKLLQLNLIILPVKLLQLNLIILPVKLLQLNLIILPVKL